MDDEKQYFEDTLKKSNDPIEGWPTSKLRKEVSGDAGMGQAQERDDIGIE